MKLQFIDFILGLRLSFWNFMVIHFINILLVVDCIAKKQYAPIMLMWILENRLLPLSLRRVELCKTAIDNRIDYLLAVKDLK